MRSDSVPGEEPGFIACKTNTHPTVLTPSNPNDINLFIIFQKYHHIHKYFKTISH